jgi:flavin-dependent dehydrogenase
MLNRKTDVVIVGAGIAGLVLSYLLHREGTDHIVLDRQGGAAAPALAETLPPAALPLLKKLGLLELFESTALQKTYGYHSCWGNTAIADHNFFFHRPYQYGLKINKQAIVAALMQQQQAYILPVDHLIAAEPSGDSILITAEKKQQPFAVQAKLAADATGRRRTLLNRLGIASLAYDELAAFTCHLPRVKHPAIKHSVYIESFEEGWGIVSALSETMNVCTLFTVKESPVLPLLKQYNNWQDILAGTQYLQYFLTADSNTKVKGAAANSSIAAEISGTGWLALGDAAISFDPLSSHGVTNAVYTAQEAAKAICSYTRRENMQAVTSYSHNISAIFNAYLQTKEQLYRNEKRFPQSSFWQQMAAPLINS